MDGVAGASSSKSSEHIGGAAPGPEGSPGGRYAPVAVALHWLLALLILFQIGLAWQVDGQSASPRVFDVLQLHKSVGITILLLTLARLGWRLLHPVSHLEGLTRWERLVSRATHLGFYALLLGLPLSGWLMVSASRYEIPTRLFWLAPWPHLPGVAGLEPGAKQVAAEAGEAVHELLAVGMYALLALHLLGVAKHQLISRDGVLGRMWPGSAPGWREPRLWTALVLVCAALLLGWTVQPSVWRRHAPTQANAPELVSSQPLDTTPAQPLPAPADRADVAPDPAAAPEPEAELAPVPRWRVQQGSALTFRTEWAGEDIVGRFGRWDADIRFSPEALERSSVTVRVDLRSVTTGDEMRDGTLATPDWFETAKHPEAVFKATRFRKVGPDSYTATGRLRIRGVEAPLTLSFKLQITDKTAKAEGRATVDRTVFHVGQGEFASTDQVPAGVRVEFDITAAVRDDGVRG